ncbi:MAG: YdeI/OmpD-associated family protein [Bacteroidota bacterium]
MDLSHAFAYAAPVLRREDGMRMHYLPVPAEVAEALRQSGTRRVVGTLNGHPVRRALHGIGNGEFQFLIGQQALRKIGASLGETVEVVVKPDPDPDHIDVPDELAAALDADPEARERWETFSAGRQRGLASHVAMAKRPATREKRALEVARKIRTHTLYGDLHGTND